MKKRLDVATALVHEPPLVFLDEPTTGLDPKSRKKLWNYFEDINDKGRTIFLTTQYLEEADQLCDRLSVIQNGEIISTGSPDELKKQVGGHILEISFPNKDSRKKAQKIAEKNGFFNDVKTEYVENTLKLMSNHIKELGPDYLAELKNKGIKIEGFNLHEPNLDDVFLTITGEKIETNNQEKIED